MPDVRASRDEFGDEPEIVVRLVGGQEKLKEILLAAGLEWFEIINRSPKGWAEITRHNAAMEAATAAAKVRIAEERLEKARRDQLRAISKAGQEAGKYLAANFAQPWLVKTASGLAGASPSLPNPAAVRPLPWWRRAWMAIRGH